MNKPLDKWDYTILILIILDFIGLSLIIISRILK